MERFRRQQLIKESNEECSKIINQGQFILYHRGKPLLEKSGLKIQDNRPQTVTYAQASKFIQNIDQEAIFLRFKNSDSDIPIFAAMIPKDATNIEEIENTVEGKFVDMRAALFLVRSDWSGLMSGGSSLLRWSTCVLVYFSWLLDHVIYLKLRIEYSLCKAEQILKITLKIVLD